MKALKFIPLILILTLVGCGKQKYITCELNINNNIQEYQLSGEYKIYYKNNYVTYIKEKETYVSSNSDTLDYLDKAKQLEYYDISDKYIGFSYTIEKVKNTIKLNTEYDFKELDIDAMVKDKRIDKDYVVGGKLTLSGIRKFYKEKGAVCEE